MARPTNASIFLRKLGELGGSSGNGALQRALAWPEKQYWSVHGALVDSGLILKGRGKGGSVILVVPETVEQAEQVAATLPKGEAESVSEVLVEVTNQAADRQETREIDLYEPAIGQLKKYWSREKSLLNGVYEITAWQGRRDTGGSWSRPDLVAVGLRKFEYLPDRVLEVYTFELKAEYDISIKGVLEALAHREFATRAYVVYHVGSSQWEKIGEAQRIEQLAARHGVGAIVASDIADFRGGWEERVVATRSASDPENLDHFIKTTLSDEAKSQIRKWF